MVRWSEGELENWQVRRPKPRATTLDVPIRVVSEANQRCHWSVRHRRFKQQAQAVWGVWMAERPKVPPGRLRITLTRVGPRKLDSDNLAGAFKGVRDQLAALIGVDDGSDRIVWGYEQEAIGKRQYAARIRIEPRES